MANSLLLRRTLHLSRWTASGWDRLGLGRALAAVCWHERHRVVDEPQRSA
jgi:hypothetical protein